MVRAGDFCAIASARDRAHFINASASSRGMKSCEVYAGGMGPKCRDGAGSVVVYNLFGSKLREEIRAAARECFRKDCEGGEGVDLF